MTFSKREVVYYFPCIGKGRKPLIALEHNCDLAGPESSSRPQDQSRIQVRGKRSKINGRVAALIERGDKWRVDPNAIGSNVFPEASRALLRLFTSAPCSAAVRRILVLLDSDPLLLGISLTSGKADRQRAFNLCKLGAGQIHVRRRGALLEMARGARAGNGHDMRRLGERPGDGQGGGLQPP
jgi:hypothetical protein